MITQKQKNKWKIEVDLGYTINGKRKRHIETFIGAKKEAREREFEIRASSKKGTLIKNDRTTFEQFGLKWFKEHAEVNMSPKTVSIYKHYFKKINEEIGTLKINEIKPLHLIRFYNNLRETKEPKPLAEATILKYYNLVNTILNKAVQWQIIYINPNNSVDKPKVKKKEARFYDEEQVQQLIKVLDKEPIKYRTLVFLALDTGARRGEITGLEWEDIDFDNNLISINKSTQRVGKKIIEKSPKTESSIRELYITTSTSDLLKEYRKNQELLKEKMQDKWFNSKKVFTTVDGKGMHPDTPSKIFRNILIKYNLPLISFHSLRHTSISLLINSGIATKAVSKRAGHSSEATTQNIYSHVFKSVEKEAANKLNDIFKNKKA